MNMCYREEAIECVKDHVLQIHKQIYAKYNGDFDRIYTEGYNSKSYTGRVIEPGKIYELSYLECTCPKVKCGLRNHPQQCECSRQSILYILSQLEPNSHFEEFRLENTILKIIINNMMHYGEKIKITNMGRRSVNMKQLLLLLFLIIPTLLFAQQKVRIMHDT